MMSLLQEKEKAIGFFVPVFCRTEKMNFAHIFRNLLLATASFCFVNLSAKIIPEEAIAVEASHQRALSYLNYEEDLSAQSQADKVAEIQRNAIQFLSEHFTRANKEDISKAVSQAFITGKKYDIDPLLILSIIAAESSFNPKAKSKAGAKGLMQVHARVHAAKFKRFGGVKAVHDIQAGIEVGTQILREYIDKSGSLAKGLKRYVGSAKHATDGGYGHKVLVMREYLRTAISGDIKAAKQMAKKGHKKVLPSSDTKNLASYNTHLGKDETKAIASDGSNAS